MSPEHRPAALATAHALPSCRWHPPANARPPAARLDCCCRCCTHATAPNSRRDRAHRSTISDLPRDRKSTRLNSSHTVIYTLSYTTLFRSTSSSSTGLLLPMLYTRHGAELEAGSGTSVNHFGFAERSEEHTSELQSHRDLHSFLHDALPIYLQQLDWTVVADVVHTPRRRTRGGIGHIGQPFRICR